MKKTLFFLAIASLSFFACSKKDDPTIGPISSSGASTTVFYVDTFRIYSTDLKGGNRKLIVDENLNSQNNFIGQISVLPTNQQLVYTYYDGTSRATQIKTCKFDGSDKKTIKTITAQTSIGFVKGTSDGYIIYQLNTFQNSTTSSKSYSIKADGTGETEIQGFLYAPFIDEEQISNQGKGLLSDDGYFFKITNGVFAESESFNILLNEDKVNTRNLILSADASKAAFVRETTTNRQYEIRIKDVLKTAPNSTILYTVNIAADANDQAPNISFVNGSKNILVSYGKFTSPKGSAADFTNCELLDVATGKITQSWKFTGDDIGHLITD